MRVLLYSVYLYGIPNGNSKDNRISPDTGASALESVDNEDRLTYNESMAIWCAFIAYACRV